MNQGFVSPELIQVANEILHWAEEFLSTENPLLKRPYGSQEICPFVKPSIKSNYFYMAFHPEVNAGSVEPIADIMLEYINTFKNTHPFKPSEQLKKTLLVIFPGIPKDQTYVLDAVHRLIKTKFVEQGLMVAQFHENCDETSVHNKKLKVNTAPHSFMAIRYMAIHDILFLKSHDTPEWFDEYNRRFGDIFRDPEKLDQHTMPLKDFYIEAKKKFSR
jgi:heptaprenyl diphosphate synthase